MNIPGSEQYGSSGDNFVNTVLSDSGITSIDSISAAGAPYTGTYYPSDGITRTYLNVFEGESINSSWRLTVVDTGTTDDNGYLVKWSLKFETDESNETTYPFVYGSTSINQNWKKIMLSKTFTNPVVILSDPSWNGSDPVTTRIRNITPNSFELKLQEPNYKDGVHAFEDIYYLVGERGTWNLNNNFKIQFGTLTSNNLSSNGFTKVSISSFNGLPIILPTIQSYNGSDWVVTRTKNITNNSFEITMQEEEKLNSGNHVDEIMGWVTVKSGEFSDSNIKILTKAVSGVNNNFKKITYQNAFLSIPNLITKLESYNGSDTANTRVKNSTKTNFEIRVQEEQSKDNETSHVNENIGYFAIL